MITLLFFVSTAMYSRRVFFEEERKFIPYFVIFYLYTLFDIKLNVLHNTSTHITLPDENRISVIHSRRIVF